MKKWIFSSALLLLFILTKAQAFEAEHVRGYQKVSLPKVALPVPDSLDSARLDKFNLALSTLGIPEEAAPDFSTFPSPQTLTSEDINSRLPYIDPGKNFRRYLNIAPANVSLFRDFFSSLLPASLLEYSFDLAQTSAPSDSQTLIAHLAQISAQVKDPTNAKPLTGLKVVIDPGHMGTDFWDSATGKYVQIGSQKVSEGMINLWTTYLVANNLENLGATVILTRTTAAPVSSDNYQTFSTTPFVNQYFYDSLDDWMAKYLGLSDSALQASIKTEPEVQKAYAESEREEFFIDGSDLSARSDIIDQQKPDIVLDIHYDADNHSVLQSSSDSVEAFVPGAFGATETGSRVIRSYAMKHLLDVRRWQSSVDLAGDIAGAMSQSEGIPLESTPGYATGVLIQNGVYARNLYITRRNLSSLMVYLECLHYDHTSEFNQFTQSDASGSYHGISFQYPSRIDSVVAGIQTGILNYFKR